MYNELTDVKSDLNQISEVYGSVKNILNYALLGTGTVKGVTVSRNEDEFTFSGTASGTDSISSQRLTILEAGQTYTAKIYSESTTEVNCTVRFYDALSGGTMLSIIYLYNTSTSKGSLNTPYTFTVPSGAVSADFKIGFFNGKTYSNDKYKFSVQKGSTNESYDKYTGEAQTLTAVDEVARQTASTKITNPSGGTSGQVLGLDGSGNPAWVNQSEAGDYDQLTNKPSINNVPLSGNKSLSDIGAASQSALSQISEITGSGNNILNPVLLGTGTVKGITISRNNDEFTYGSGTASGSDTLTSQSIPLNVGETYTLKVYTSSAKKINFYVRFYNGSSVISTIQWVNASDLNDPKTFTVPANTTRVVFNIGVLNGTVYANDVYKFSIQHGSTNDSYDQYGEIVTAKDAVARRDISLLSESVPAQIEEAIGGVEDSIAMIADKSPNILNAEWLGTGTVQNVVITRTDDVLKYNGASNGTDSVNGTKFDIDDSKTYTAIVFTESMHHINSRMEFYDSNGTDLGYILLRNATTPIASINTPYTFTPLSGAVKAMWKIGVLTSVTYDNDEYQFELVEGSTSPDSYRKYNSYTAIDEYARSQIQNLEADAPCYVSPSGSDSNSGKLPTMPFATFQHAIDAGYKRIIAAPGEYKNQQLVMSGLHGVSIVCNSTTTEANLFDSHVRRTRAKIDNSIDVTGLTASDSVYRTALTVDNDSSFYKVFVSKTLDPVYSGSEYYGRITTYNAILWELTDDIRTCTRLVPKLTLAECQSTQGSFFYDGSYLYVNPTGGSLTGKTYKRLNMDTTQIGIAVSNCTDVLIQGIDVAFFPFSDMQFSGGCTGIVLKDCTCTFTSYRTAFQFNGADATCYGCIAGQAGADGYGISAYGDCSFYDCSAIRCYDDGISHHDATTGVIDGGEWAHCLKGGVTPSYGSKVDVKNVYAHDNVYGVYYPQSEGRVTDYVPKVSGCLAIDNTSKDIKITGYDVISFGCTYRTKEVDTGATLAEYGNNVLN